ncbi:MAG: hypothetical protein ACLS28_23345 [Clostridium neonatale]
MIIGILLVLIIGVVIGVVTTKYFKDTEIFNITEKLYKYKEYYQVLNMWLQLKIENGSLEKYFLENNYKTIASYGMGELGEKLYLELKDTDIRIKYCIDNSDRIRTDLRTYKTEDTLPKVDIIIITPIYDYNNIYAELKKKNDYKIQSISDIINGV